MRKRFASVVAQIITDNENTMLLLGDIGVFSFRESIEKYPKRVINMGILEQTMIGVAAGISKSGMHPFVHTIAPFLVERAHEQLKVDFGYQHLSGNFVAVGASYDYSSLGATHHAPADVEVLLGIPGFQICIPGHPTELEKQLLANFDNDSATYFRISELCNKEPVNTFGKSVARLKQGGRATVIVVGPFLDRTLEACNSLDCEVIYLNEISSDTEIELRRIISNDRLIIVEPFYEGTLNHLVVKSTRSRFISICNIGVPRKFIHSYGTVQQLDDEISLSASQIRKRIIEFIE